MLNMWMTMPIRMGTNGSRAVDNCNVDPGLFVHHVSCR